jgi:hypothetical protein
MTDIQRWAVKGFAMRDMVTDEPMEVDDIGPWVTYADAKAWADRAYRDGYNAHASGEIHSYQVYGLGPLHLPGCIHDPRHPDHGAYPCNCATEIADAVHADQDTRHLFVGDWDDPAAVCGTCGIQSHFHEDVSDEA